jgi:hypothetical protein
MAATSKHLVEVLNSSAPIPSPFELLSGIATLTSVNGYTSENRELVIRALGRKDEFGQTREMLSALVREYGLYPYLNSEDLPLSDLLAREMHRPGRLGDIVFHRVQAQIYRQLLSGQNIILSAPTSFGKSLIVDALAVSGRYQNIVVIVPTIALIDETRRRLSGRETGHKIITHPSQGYAERNLFVLTQERYLALETPPKPDLFFIDEFYKLDERPPVRAQEHLLTGRAALLNEALYRLLKTGAQFYLAGPNIHELSRFVPINVQRTLIETDFATTAANIHLDKAKNDTERRRQIIYYLETLPGPTMIYCRSPKRVRDVAKWLMEDLPDKQYGHGMSDAADWLDSEYHGNWNLPKALRRGIGTHHGRLPRWLAQRVVHGFNDGSLGVLICNNTLIEGVNTTAKNVIILDRTLAGRAYNFFTFMNIKGRGGRMFKHFVGNIITFYGAPDDAVPSVDMPGLSQSEAAPSSLLLSIDEVDRTEASRDRLKILVEQELLSEENMRGNQGIEPELQLALAKHLALMSKPEIRNLQWSTSHPNNKQLLSVIRLVWEFFAPDSFDNHGVKSAEQLNRAVMMVALAEGNIRSIIQDFVDDTYNVKESTDDKIEKCFDFLRYWIDHNLPQMMRAVDSIANEVLIGRGFESGAYGSFISRLEDGFHPHLFTTLEEYGIPVQILHKIRHRLPKYESLDGLLQWLREIDVRDFQELNEFERGTLTYAVSGI